MVLLAWGWSVVNNSADLLGDGIFECCADVRSLRRRSAFYTQRHMKELVRRFIHSLAVRCGNAVISGVPSAYQVGQDGSSPCTSLNHKYNVFSKAP